MPVGLRDHLRGTAPPEAEHRLVAIAFLEFRGTDELLEREGAEAVADALDECVRTVQEESARHAVTFLDSDISHDGGKILLVAGAPSNSGHDEEAMLLAVRSIMDRSGRLPLRIGVNAGRVFAAVFGPPYRRSYSIRGDAVNLAARVMGKAAEGQILATDAALARSRTRFETHELPPFTVKGKAKPVQAFVLGAPDRRRLGQRDAPPLIGRDHEMRALSDALESATRRRGRVVELVGEPGMGKSRMVEELISQAGNMTLLLARCELYENSSAYQPFRGLLRDVLGIKDREDPIGAARRLRDRVEANAPHLLPWLPLLGIPMDIEMPMTPETEQLEVGFRRRQLEAVTEELLEWVLPTPTLFVFDDVHWMDEASADLLARIVAKAADLPWLILVTRRESEDGFKVPEGVDALSLTLKPLDAADAARFLETSAGGRPLPAHELAAMAERSGGNPLFLRELGAVAGSDTLEQALPDTVEDLMTAEIDRLDPIRSCAPAARVGPRNDVPALRARRDARRRTGTSRRTGLASAGRFHRGGGTGDAPLPPRLACETPPTRGCPSAADGSSTPRRATPSRASSDDEAEDRAAILSMHFFHAHRYEDAWSYARVAADRARGKYALVDAGALYRRAIDAARSIPGIPAWEVAEVHESRGDLLDRLGAYDEAAASYRAARRLVGGDPLAESKLYLKEAWISDRLGHYRQGLRWVTRGRQALEGVDGQEAGRQRARLSAWYAALRQGQGRYREVMAWCELAIKEAEASGEREALAQAYFILDWALVDLGELEKATYSARALEIYLELGNLGSAATVLNNMGMFAYFRGRWDEAIDLYQQGHDMRIKIGDTVDAAMGPMNIGEILSDQGRLDEAETMFREVLRIWTAAGRKEFIALTTSDLARVESRAEDAPRRWSCTGRRSGCSRRSATTARSWRPRLGSPSAGCSRAISSDALDACDASLRRARTIGGVPPQVPLLHRVRGWALMQTGRPDDARRAFEESLEDRAISTGGLRDRDGAVRPGRARSIEAGTPDDDDGAREPSHASTGWASFESLGVPARRLLSSWARSRLGPQPERAPNRSQTLALASARVAAVPPQQQEPSISVGQDRLRADALRRVGDARRRCSCGPRWRRVSLSPFTYAVLPCFVSFAIEPEHLDRVVRRRPTEAATP